MQKKILLMTGIAFLLAMHVFGICHAKELEPFRDGNPRYPLVRSWEMFGTIFYDYLDLDSCTIVSEEDGFELSAVICHFTYSHSAPEETYEHQACHFRKNAESNGELQFWKDDECGNNEWRTIILNPYDRESIEQILDEGGHADYPVASYYLFKCVYQQIFGEPYEDDVDDEALRNSAMNYVAEKEKRRTIPRYLWDDENYPVMWAKNQELSWYLDKSSVYVETEDDSKHILRALVLDLPRYHNNVVMPLGIRLDRLLFDEDEGKMYVWGWGQKKWYYVKPDGMDTMSRREKSVGNAVYKLVYGERFYEDARSDSPVIHKSDKWFYTDKDRTNYFLRQFHMTDAWIEAQVMRKKADGTTDSFLYYVYTYKGQCPYTIYSGTYLGHPGEAVERGELHADSDGTPRSDANPSVVAFFKWFRTRR